MNQPDASKTFVAKKRRKRIRKWITSVIVLIGIGIAAWYLFFQPTPEEKPVIRFAVVDKGDIIKAISATGTIQATKTVQVGSQVSGTIKALYADFNSQVKAGQVVAELDPTFYQAAVKEAEANYERAKAEAENAKSDAQRASELYKRDLISRAEYDAAQTKVNTTVAAVSQTKAALDRSKVNLGYTIIRSPINGTVVSRNVDVGQTVAASLNAPVLFTIAEDLKKMEVQVNVDESDVGQVLLGQEVMFTVDAFPMQKFSGKVTMVRISPTVAQNVVTYTVIASADNDDLRLLPGMTATTTIVSESKTDVLRIPSAALRFRPPDDTGRSAGSRTDRGEAKRGDSPKREGGSFGKVYRKNGTTLSPTLEIVKLKTGISDGMYTEVVGDDTPLKAGDSVAVGSMMLGAKSSSSQPSSGNPFGGTQPRGGGPMRRAF